MGAILLSKCSSTSEKVPSGGSKDSAKQRPRMNVHVQHKKQTVKTGKKYNNGMSDASAAFTRSRSRKRCIESNGCGWRMKDVGKRKYST